ncbi:hypothetical protein I350_00850 [Cryptococcus amylolentus CBS 6273]|uniref:Uncharacterized protein n=1 Tax=Cryptococcus amylolentus CBS 6273 TaxID=1296118 RepID=A0A1E3KGC5_9TREE|nr:hypothetical protein I350_00850 [Cryptococcus amylolentus CBS 6273]
MANTRPYTRDELKSLRRADLQTLFKVHKLKGATGTTAVLIDHLVDFFASPAYQDAYPPPTDSQASQGTVQVNAGKGERMYKTLPQRTAVAKGAAGGVRRKAEGATVRAGTKGAAPTTAPVSARKQAPRAASRMAGTVRKRGQPQKEVQEEVVQEDASAGQEEASIPANQPPIFTPQPSATPRPIPSSPSSIQEPAAPALTVADVQTLLRENDEKWKDQLQAVEARLGQEVERLRSEVQDVRRKCEELERAERARAPRPSSTTPGHPRILGGQNAPYTSHQRSASVPWSGSYSSLGKRRHPHEHRVESEDAEAKRVRFNANRAGEPASDATTSDAQSQPRTPSPRQAPSSFPPNFFAQPALPPTTSSHASVLPRTPSPSRQGIVPDNSQTPRPPSEWRAQYEYAPETGPLRTPYNIERTPEFATTPEPPLRGDISPSLDGGALSGRLTPGHIRQNLPSTPDQPDEEDFAPSGIALSTVTDLERIDESEELPSSRQTSPASHLRAQANAVLGLGVGATLSSASPRPQPRSISVPNQPTTPSLLGQHSLLAPPAFIARTRAGSERPSFSARAQTHSPPPRPRSASAVHRPSGGGPGRRTPSNSRHASPALLATVIPTERDESRVRSASADYMRIAKYGFETSLDTIDDPDLSPTDLPIHRPTPTFSTSTLPPPSSIATDTPGPGGSGSGPAGAGAAERRRWIKKDEVATPGQRTLLGTERYNDTRFGDMPVGFWAQPGVDLGTPGTPF